MIYIEHKTPISFDIANFHAQNNFAYEVSDINELEASKFELNLNQLTVTKSNCYRLKTLPNFYLVKIFDFYEAIIDNIDEVLSKFDQNFCTVSFRYLNEIYYSLRADLHTNGKNIRLFIPEIVDFRERDLLICELLKALNLDEERNYEVGYEIY